MPKEKKAGWKTPELIVLGRSRPEEAVLTACKYIGAECCQLIGDGEVRAACAGVKMTVEPPIGESGRYCSCIKRSCDSNCEERCNS